MKRKRFTEEQIIAVLKEHEAGMKTGDVARRHGISQAALYNWKAKFGGMDVSEAKRLRALEDENGKLNHTRHWPTRHQRPTPKNSPQQAIKLRPSGAPHASLLHNPPNRAYKC